MFIGDIQTASPFRDLFPIIDKVLEGLYWDMQKNGFDPSKPIVLWESHNSIVIDGHMRLRAAKKAGLIQVPVVLKKFDTEEEALGYAVHCQRNRRNITDREIIQCIETLDKRKDKLANLVQNRSEAPDGASGKTSAMTASLLGVSTRKVERARAILDNAPDEVRDAVKAGDMTINSAYNQTPKRPQKGSPEAIKLAAEEIEQIKQVFGIIKERLNRDQMHELMKYIAQEIVNGKE
jgi:ParB family chromosome partitioning protein